MSLSQQTPRSIEIVPLTLHIGAEIRGVDLTRPLPPQQVKEVRDAFAFYSGDIRSRGRIHSARAAGNLGPGARSW